MIDSTYMPYTPEQLLPHFTGDAEANVDYFVRSARRWREYIRGVDTRAQPLTRARGPRQMEKDERFWTLASLKSVFDRPDREAALTLLLTRTFGDAPPVEDLSTWSEALASEHLQLYTEAQLPSPVSYVTWLRQHVGDRHLVPYVLDAASASTRRLEGATHVDAILLNPDNGFSVLIEAKVLSDISPSVSFDMYRNQLIRNVDVMIEPSGGQQSPLDQRDPDRSLFALLTPEAFRDRPHTRFYGWLFREYRNTPEALARDLPHRGDIDWPGLCNRLGWMTFEDISDVEPDACRWL